MLLKPQGLVQVLAVTTLVASCSRASVPSMMRHDFDSFSISVPAAWSVKVWKQDSTPNGPTPSGRAQVSDVRFEGPDGEFLTVHDEDFDLSGRYEADARWKLAALPGAHVEVLEDGGLCVRPPDWSPGHPCTAGDGRLDALAHLQAGPGFEITFGNTKRERAEDLKPFKAILATFRAK